MIGCISENTILLNQVSKSVRNFQRYKKKKNKGIKTTKSFEKYTKTSKDTYILLIYNKKTYIYRVVTTNFLARVVSVLVQDQYLQKKQLRQYLSDFVHHPHQSLSS